MFKYSIFIHEVLNNIQLTLMKGNILAKRKNFHKYLFDVTSNRTRSNFFHLRKCLLISRDKRNMVEVMVIKVVVARLEGTGATTLTVFLNLKCNYIILVLAGNWC